MTDEITKAEPAPAIFEQSAGTMAESSAPWRRLIAFNWLTVAVLAMAGAGQAEIAMAPFVLSMIADHYQVSESISLFIIGAQLAAFALTAFLVSGSMGRSRWSIRTQAGCGVALTLLSQVVSLMPVGLYVLAIARATAGIGEGITVAIAYGLISRMESFSSMLAIQGAVMAAVVVGMLLLVPLANDVFGSVGLFVPLVVIAALTLLMTPALPTAYDAMPRAEQNGPALKGVAVVALVGMFVSAASNTLWLFMDEIGTKDGLSLSTISRVTALSAASCIVAPYFAYHTERRFGSIIPGTLLCVVQAVLGWYFTRTDSPAIYIVTSFGLNLTYSWCMVAVRIASADYDATGHAPSAVAGAESFGLVIGPLLAAAATSLWPGYATIGILAGAGFASAALALLWFKRIADPR